MKGFISSTYHKDRRGAVGYYRLTSWCTLRSECALKHSRWIRDYSQRSKCARTQILRWSRSVAICKQAALSWKGEELGCCRPGGVWCGPNSDASWTRFTTR